ncbi:MAG: penicillin acylase family protein, partial [Chloroflexi bacterium]|nr:penicillin acylase family protein [Chloroflexota bacterium]
TPLQIAILPHNPYEARSFAPSHRQIFDLTNWDNARMVSIPGQSGRITSPHYADQLNLWQNGEHHPMLWSRDAVEAQAEARLALHPKANEG